MMTGKKYAYQLIADKLRKDISAGKFTLNKRLPGCRKIGEMYDVCMITARQALQTLGKEGIVFIHPTRGTFVSPEFFSTGGKKRSFAVLYDTSLIELLEFSYESWGIMTDILHGIRQEAVDQNIRVKFLHFEKDGPSGRRASQLEPYDGVIFFGEILPALFQELCRKHPKRVLRISSNVKDRTPAGEIALPCAPVFDRIAAQIRMAGYTSVDILTPFGSKEESKVTPDKLKTLICSLQQQEIGTVRKIDFHDPKQRDLLFKPVRDRLIYAYNTSAMEPVYRHAAALHQTPGKDFEIIAFASGYTFANFYPSITYYRPEYFELGREAVRVLLGLACEDLTRFPAFIQGMSSRAIPELALR